MHCSIDFMESLSLNNTIDTQTLNSIIFWNWSNCRTHLAFYPDVVSTFQNYWEFSFCFYSLKENELILTNMCSALEIKETFKEYPLFVDSPIVNLADTRTVASKYQL